MRLRKNQDENNAKKNENIHDMNCFIYKRFLENIEKVSSLENNTTILSDPSKRPELKEIIQKNLETERTR